MDPGNRHLGATDVLVNLPPQGVVVVVLDIPAVRPAMLSHAESLSRERSQVWHRSPLLEFDRTVVLFQEGDDSPLQVEERILLEWMLHLKEGLSSGDSSAELEDVFDGDGRWQIE